jgi:hypothetical protein
VSPATAVGPKISKNTTQAIIGTVYFLKAMAYGLTKAIKMSRTIEGLKK